MRIEVHYFADDDTEFDTEQECIEYESVVSELFDSVSWFNENHTLLEQADYYDIEDMAMFMFVHDAAKAKVLFSKLSEMISFEPPKEEPQDGSVFAYDTDMGEWIDMKKRAMKIMRDATSMSVEAKMFKEKNNV